MTTKPRTKPRLRKPAEVRTCANGAHPHEGPIHARGLCEACASYQARMKVVRPAGLIQVALMRDERRAVIVAARAAGGAR